MRRSSPLFFIPPEPYPARSARHLPHAGKALSIVILFLHVSYIRFDDAGIAASSYRSLPHWERGTAQRRSGALVNCRFEMHFLALFHPARTLSGSLCSPPSPRGEGFVRRYSFSTYPVFALTIREKRYSRIAAFPIGEGGPRQRWIGCSRIMAHLRRSPPLFFIPLVPYPARFARHLPHAGKALSVVILFPHILYSL